MSYASHLKIFENPQFCYIFGVLQCRLVKLIHLKIKKTPPKDSVILCIDVERRTIFTFSLCYFLKRTPTCTKLHFNWQLSPTVQQKNF